MTCQAYDERIGDYVDGTLAAGDVARLDAHLGACARCQAMVADLRAIRSIARSLAPHAPPPQVWRALAEATRSPRPSPLRAWLFGWQPVAATAMIAVMATALSWVGGRLATLDPPPSSLESMTTSAAALLDVPHDAAEAHYISAIASLEELTSVERATLEPAMVDVLDTGMTIIDTAIDQSRAALVVEPDSQIAQDSLFQALRNKVALLQGTLTLVDEVRRGDQDGAGPLPESTR
jgi:anti-sigma factor RsiW